MAEVEMKDVVTGIEKLFKSGTHFVFWYDKNGEFAENIDIWLKNLMSQSW